MKQKICVLYGSLNPGGGAERVTAVIAHVLRDKFKRKVTLCLADKPSSVILDEYKSYLNDLPIELSPFSRFPNMCFLGRTFVLMCHEFYVNLKHRYDLIVNMAGVFTPLSCVGDIIYVHFPVFYFDLVYEQSTVRRIYGATIKSIGSIMKIFLAAKDARPRMIIVNSRYTLEMLNQFLYTPDSIVDVLYPPVDVMHIMQRTSFDVERENIVMTISRISEEKNLLIIPEVATKLKDFKFVIAGRVRNPRYLESLIEKIKVSHLSNVNIVTNVTEDAKIRLLQKAKICLHPTQYEAFGISIIECMSAGLTPVTHDSGGPREFVPNEQRFNGLDDLIDKIDVSMHSWTPDIARENAANALKFDTRECERKAQKLFRSLL